MRRVFALLSASLIVVAVGCGSAGTGSACGNLSADLKGIAEIQKRNFHGTESSVQLEANMSSSERRARDDLQLKAREAIAACKREGRIATPSP